MFIYNYQQLTTLQQIFKNGNAIQDNTRKIKIDISKHQYIVSKERKESTYDL